MIVVGPGTVVVTTARGVWVNGRAASYAVPEVRGIFYIRSPARSLICATVGA